MLGNSTNTNRFVLRTFHLNITHLAMTTRKTIMEVELLKCGNKVETNSCLYGRAISP